MSFSVSKKYTKSVSINEAEQYRSEILKLLESWSAGGFLNKSVYNRLMELFPYAQALYPNSYTKLYRGACFRQSDFAKYSKLALKFLTKQIFETKQIRSWSHNQENADEFSYHLFEGSATVTDTINGSITISVNIPKGIGIDISKALKKESDSENEIILPPGIYQIKVENAALFVPLINKWNGVTNVRDTHLDLGYSFCMLNGKKTFYTFDNYYPYQIPISYNGFIKVLNDTIKK